MNGGKYFLYIIYIENQIIFIYWNQIRFPTLSHHFQGENHKGKQRSYTDRTRFEQKYLIKFV